jgi:E3 ubiquitin-protein ligase DMA1/2
VWHYKCIRPILNGPTYPNLTCPNCRAAHDLQADIEEVESEWEDEIELQQAIEASKKDNSTSATSLAANTIPSHQRPSVDQDGDSPMPDHIPHSSAPVPQRPPPPPPTESQSDAALINQTLEQRLQTGTGASSATPPRDIPPRANSNSNSNSRFELAPSVNGIVTDGPMTPRNDAGPFVLDGGAGRTTAATSGAPVSGGNRPRASSHISLSHEDGDGS